jgi:flagellar L-ring protein precursor FlgH
MMRLLLSLGLALFVSACATQQKSELGVAPALSPVGSGYAPPVQAAAAYPAVPPAPLKRYSLWDDRQSRLFTDPRALEIGDILTVNIKINDRARFRNESERARTSNRVTGLGGAFAVGGVGSDASLDFDVGSNSRSTGQGATERSEAIDMQVAAIVSDVLPNGNLVISGSQEVRVNAELRILTIAGIVRPSDIGASNTISYDRIAEARVSYGGRGRLTEVQQPTYGQQILDTVLPF